MLASHESNYDLPLAVRASGTRLTNNKWPPEIVIAHREAKIRYGDAELHNRQAKLATLTTSMNNQNVRSTVIISLLREVVSASRGLSYDSLRLEALLSATSTETVQSVDRVP